MSMLLSNLFSDFAHESIAICCNGYQCNTVSNTFGSILDLVLAINNNLAVSRACFPLLKEASYHPFLIMSLSIPTPLPKLVNNSSVILTHSLIHSTVQRISFDTMLMMLP